MKSKWLAMAAFAGAWALPAQAQMVKGQDPGTLVRALLNSGPKTVAMAGPLA